MKKVIVLGAVMALVVGVFVLGDVDGVKAETIELKLAHFMSPKHVQHVNSFVPFAKKVEELTGGKVKIKIYPGGTLGGPKQLPDAVKTGITDIAFMIPAYVTGRFMRYSVLDLPFMVDSAGHATRTIYDMYDKYLAEDFKDYKVLWLYSCGPGQVISAGKEVKTIQDLKGMKVRSPSAYMSKSLNLLGANPIGMPISKLAISLQKKIIDGMLGPYSSIYDFRLADLVHYTCEINLYVIPMAVLMNKKKYNSLPDYGKNAIDEASGMQWGLHAAKVYDEQDADALEQIKKMGKIKTYVMAQDELEKIREGLKPLELDWVKTVDKKGIPGAEILNAAHVSAAKTR